MNRLRELRINKGLNISTAARMLDIPFSTYSNYERGVREPNSETLIKLANFYETSIDYLLGLSGEKQIVSRRKEMFQRYDNVRPLTTSFLPFIGKIACGKPIFAEEECGNYVEAGGGIKADFCLKAKGDSMIDAHIYDGDLVFIREQPMVENGEIAAVVIEDEATLKRVFYDQKASRLVLNAANSAYEPLVYEGKELSKIRILGKAVATQAVVR